MSDAIDLSKLPPPDAIEALDAETILAAMVADFAARYPAAADVIDLASEPVVKLLEVVTARELSLRARINDAYRAVIIATAEGADLDNLLADRNIARLVIDPGDPGAVPAVPPTYESDTDFRYRGLLALDGLSTAGPRAGYERHALGADGDVKDVEVLSPAPSEITVTVLARSGDGTPSAGVLAAVEAAVSADTVRPLGDRVTVLAATVVTYNVTASLSLTEGSPDAAVVKAAAEAAIAAYGAEQNRVGAGVSVSGLYKALHQAGVSEVTLTSPAGGVAATAGAAPRLGTVTITVI